jgi:hypothetical protein
MPATYFEFWLIGVESPKTEKERERKRKKLHASGFKSGSVGYPTGYQIPIQEQQHPSAAGS